MAADAVDLALDTAGTIGSIVGGMAHMVGIGSPEKDGHEEQQTERREMDEASHRVSSSLQQEADIMQPARRKAPHKAKSSSGHTTAHRRARRSKSVSAKGTKKTTKRRAA